MPLPESAFSISHRLSGAKLCDNILVIKGRENVECRTHDELIEKNGILLPFHIWLNFHNQYLALKEEMKADEKIRKGTMRSIYFTYSKYDKIYFAISSDT